ncbi:NADPH-dependent FMN reductase, partial [Lactococcus lactis subsp. lactis]|nr:NADPH-dependent FMN reductase [Lactococcus lactis subsp. lactis]
QAMYYPNGDYAGINEIVLNFKPWLDWYLNQTGQHLSGGNKVDATSGASSTSNTTIENETDATSGASSH